MVLLVGLLLAGSEDNDACSASHGDDAQNAEHPGTMVTGLGQVEAAGVDHGQRSVGVDAAVVLQHIDVVAVNGSGGGQQVVLQMLLGHVVQDIGQVAVGLDVAHGDSFVDNGLCVTGIVLDQTDHILGIDVAQLHSLNLGDDDLDVILEEGIAVVSADFGDGVHIILQTLDDDLALTAAGGHRNEMGGISLGLHVVNDIVDALCLVQLGLDEVVVGVVMDDELNVLEVAVAVGEQLGQVDAVGINVRVVNEGVVVGGVRTLPGQDDLVGVAGIAVGHGIVGIHGGLVGDAQGAVGEAAVDHAGAGVNSLGGVDLGQAALGHGDSHNGLTGSGGGVGNGEEPVSFLPGGDQIGAGIVGEELQNHVVLVVGQAGRQGIDEGVGGQVGGLGGDRRQGGNQLIVDDITGGSGASMGKAVGDVGGGAAVLAGVGDLLTQSLFQAGNTGQVLGVDGNIIDPAGAAVGGITAVNRGHGQAHQERIAGGGDHFRDCGFHDQIQTQIQVADLSLAILIGQGHLHAVVGGDVLLQSILDGGGIGFQTGGQSVDQDIGLVEILGGIQLVSVGVTLGTVLQTQCLQEVSAHGLVDAVQDFHMVVGAVVSGGLGELDDVSDAQVGELDPLDGIAVAGLAIAQIGGVVIVTVTDCAAQRVIHVLVVYAGGNIGGVPDTVLFTVGNIVLEDGQGCLGIGVDGGIGHGSCINSRNGAQAHNCSEGQCKETLHRFH